jgi:hypothetical protein
MTGQMSNSSSWSASILVLHTGHLVSLELLTIVLMAFLVITCPHPSTTGGLSAQAVSFVIGHTNSEWYLLSVEGTRSYNF